MIFFSSILVSMLLSYTTATTYYYEKLVCHATSPVVTDAWCNENCNLKPPNCPGDMCICDTPPPSPTPAPPPTPKPIGNTWAVLAAGSSTYWNYRHQADVCHAYQILIKHGVKPEHIILMMYDDVAHLKENPWPGKLFNEPNGPDVYGGCVIDYKGSALSPSLYLNVLLGNSEAVKNVEGSGKVLKSGPNDRVFINFADHGGPGMIMFPGGSISASDLQSTIRKMHQKKMYKQLVYYLDTCESGSMFLQLPTDINVYAATSAYPGQPANAIWCYTPDTIIQGKNIGACLGDVFSVGWMIDSDKYFSERIKEQVAKVKRWCAVNRCNPVPCVSLLCRYGDYSIELEPVGWFQGDTNNYSYPSNSFNRAEARSINGRDVKLVLLREAWLNAPNENVKTVAWTKLQREVDHRNQVDAFFSELASTVSGSQFDVNSTRVDVGEDLCKKGGDITPTTDLDCHSKLLHIFDTREDCPKMIWGDYSAKHAGLLAKFCDKREQLGATTEQIIDQIRSFCQ